MNSTTRVQEWRRSNPDKYRQGYKQWYQQRKARLGIPDKKQYGPGKSQEAAAKAFHERKPWYRCWQQAHQRCENPNDSSYKFYGARGIRCHLTQADIEKLWKRDKAEAMERPSIDRIDSLKDYTLDNCQFLEHRDNCKKAVIDAAKRRAAKIAPALARDEDGYGRLR